MEEEVILEPFPLARRHFVDVEDDDAGLREFGAQFAPAPLLRVDQRRDAFADALELLGRRTPVVRGLDHPGQHLPDQSGDTHHEEFVEIVGRNR